MGHLFEVKGGNEGKRPRLPSHILIVTDLQRYSRKTLETAFDTSESDARSLLFRTCQNQSVSFMYLHRPCLIGKVPETLYFEGSQLAML